MPRKILTNIYLSRAQRKRLKEIARLQDSNMSALVRDLIDRAYMPPPDAKKDEAAA